MSNDHSHTHSHAHTHEVQSNLTFDEKVIKLLEHWVKHNDDHAATYRDWAQRANENNMTDAGRLIADAADMTMAISKKFEEAAKIIQKKQA